LPPVRRREVDQAVGVEGVGVLRLVQVVVQPFLGGEGGHAVVGGLGLRQAHAVFAGQHGGDIGVRRARGLRVRVEAAPDYLYLVAMRELGQGRLQPPLADIAPGANHIRPNFNFHKGSSFSDFCCAIRTAR
jgi:hypothetical protein